MGYWLFDGIKRGRKYYMGWEMRRGELYYYRKIREGERVRSVYFGRGERALAAALEDGCPHPDVLNIQSVKKEVELPVVAAAVEAVTVTATAPSAVETFLALMAAREKRGK